MIWLILSFIILVVLLAINFMQIKAIKPETKPYVIALLVILLLVFCIVDELTIPQIQHPVSISKQYGNEYNVQDYQPPPLNISTDLYWNFPPRSIVKDERILLDYLQELHRNKENVVLYIKDIDIARFRAVFKQFQKNKQGSLPKKAIQLDFSSHLYVPIDLVSLEHSDEILYIVAGEIQTLNDFYSLEAIYHNFNVSIILIDLPALLFPFSTLYQYTSIYTFNNNWIAQVLQNHPSRLIELCNKYRTIDYKFYLLSQSEPLAELCTQLPSNHITECIKKQFPEDSTPQTSVRYSKVKHCWPKGSGYTQGIWINNGLVGLKKEYYYSGLVKEQQFTEKQYNTEGL